MTETNAHPHLDCTGSIAIVHNGIVENYESLKKTLTKHTFKSETDTEVVVHLIEDSWKLGRSFAEAVRSVFNRLEGLNAIIAINNKTREFVAIRNGSPLVAGFGKGENFLASDAAALLSHTREVHFLEDDEMMVLSDKDAKLFDAKSGREKEFKKQTLNWTIAQAELGDYSHFMLKEIYEQPHVIADIADSASRQVKEMANLIKNYFSTYLLGCGSASYVAIAGTYLFSKIAKRHVNWAVGSEFGYQLDFLTEKSLVLAISQSGETIDILESVKKAKQRGAIIAALVNVMGSTLYRQADHKMLIGAGPEKSVASTKALTGKLSHLTLLAYALAGKLGEGKKVVAQAASSSTKVLGEQASHIKKLAKKLKNVHHIYVVGRGLSYPASLETALKIKEISYIHGEGFAAGELKHGVLALVEKGTPCITFLPSDETYGANLAGAMEMKARGGYIIGISHKSHEVFDYFILVEDAKEATIIPNIIVGQLLAYYLTIEKGLDPDRPRNLAKSVVVK